MSISDRDFEALSAYLDGELTGKALARLEARLETNQNMQEAYEQLKRTRKLVRSLPKMRAPRNYLLTPEMVGIVQKPSRVFPVLRFASVLATLLLILVFMGDFFMVPDLALAPSEAIQFEQSAVEEPIQPILEAEIVESQPPEAPAEGEMDRAIPEAEALPAAPEAIIAPEEEAAPEEDAQFASTLAAPAEELADDLGALAEPSGEPLHKIETRTPEPQMDLEEDTGINLQAAIRMTEIALIIIALSTGLTAYYLYRRYQ